MNKRVSLIALMALSGLISAAGTLVVMGDALADPNLPPLHASDV